MRKTSVYLSEEESDRLGELARIEQRSRSEIIRRAIGEYRPRSSPDRGFLLFDSGGSSDGRSVAEIPEEELLEGFGE